MNTFTTITLPLGETAWIGAGPEVIPDSLSRNYPAWIASALFDNGGRATAVWIEELNRLQDSWMLWHWREMQEGAGPVPSCAHDWQLDEIQWLVKTTPQKHNQTCRLCGEKRFL